MFHTTETQEGIQKNIRQFAEEEVKPIAYQLDLGNEFPHEAMYKLGHMGYLGIPFPKEYEGLGLDYLSYIIAVEELSRVDGGTGLTFAAHISQGTYPIYRYGTEAQKQKYLPSLVHGVQLAAFAATEPNAGSDLASIETSASPVRDHYILNGNKLFVTNAPEANVYIVIASTSPGLGCKGLSAFIVEKDMPGFIFGDTYDKMGVRSSSTAELFFVDVPVPKANLLGKEGDGFQIAMSTLDSGRIAIAAQALGIAQGAYEQALEHAKSRAQFGKPIAQFQGVSFKLAEMATKLHATRLMVYHAAQLKDASRKHTVEAAMAKEFAAEACTEITEKALQIFGGMGYLKGMDIERAYRDAKMTSLCEGTSEIQKLIIAHNILGSVAKEKPPTRQKTKFSETGERKNIILEGTPEQQVESLLEALVYEGYDFSIGIPLDMPITQAERLVCVGKGIGAKENMILVEAFAQATGCAMSTTRPLAEGLKYVPLNRYVGISGQTFYGNLFFAIGTSGSSQLLSGAKDATTIVAINSNKNARIFKNCDYGIIGNAQELLPLLSKAFHTGETKKPAPPMVKMKKVAAKKQARNYPLYLCCGCAYEYDKELGDPEREVPPDTDFHRLPEDWICPECGDHQDDFLEIT